MIVGKRRRRGLIGVLSQFGMLIGLGTALILLLAVFSFLHPIGDSFAVIQIPLAMFGLLFAVLAWPAWLRVLLAAVAGLALVQVGLTYMEREPAGPVKIYQKNLLQSNNRTPEVLRDLRAIDPEVVTLQEMSTQLFDSWKAEADNYTTRHFCANSHGVGSAILTKWPEVAGSGFCHADGKFAALQVKTPEGPLWLVSLHLNWPWPYEQGWQVPLITRDLLGLGGPILIGGDFNNMPWSSAVTRIAEAAGGRRAGGVKPTLYLFSLPMPIDNVIAPGGGRIETRPTFCSDHLGLVGRVSLRSGQ